MDSPLEFLRRNQKTLLPVIAIGCMVAFVVLPGLMTLMSERQQARGVQNPVLATWQGGELRQSDLQQEVHEHQLLAYFISQLQTQKMVIGNPQYANPQILGYLQNAAQNEFLQTNYGPTSLSAAADAKLFDQIGKDLGIVITDKQVNDYLDDICGQPAIGTDGKPTGAVQTIVPASMFNDLLQRIAKNDPSFTEPRLFKLVQRMLLRTEVLRLFSLQNVFAAETPLARWENYLRIRQRSSIQVLPVKVADFVKDVPEPKPEELSKFFEANKSRPADPNSPEVGLRTPVRASFQLAFVNLDQLISSFKPRIENKAISDYYEKNKDLMFRKSKLPALDSEKSESEKSGTEPGKDGETKPTDTQPADPAAPVTPETKTPETKTPETTTPETKSGASKPAETGTTEAEPTKSEPPKSAPEVPKQDAPKKQSSLARDGLLPVNFQADLKQEPVKETPKAADPIAKDPAAKQPTTEPAKPEPTKEEPAKTEPAATQPATTEPAKTEPVEYKSLAEVEEEIRTTLATEQANVQAEALIQKIEDEMYAYKKRRDRAFDAVVDPTTVKFDDFDMAKVTAAVDPTVEAETLSLVSRDQFAKHPVSATQAAFIQGAPILIDVAFNEKSFPLYEPIRPRSFTGRYVIWKTEQRPDEVPSLSDPAVKERTIAAWKMVEARKAAEKLAKDYAELARKAQQAATDGKSLTLVQLHADKLLPVAPSEIGSFSWMTPSTQRNEPPTISKVSGLDSAGPDLMKEIFSLAKNQIGVAANQPKTVYYVIQVIETDDVTKLRESFLQDVRTPGGWSQFAAANLDQQYAESRAFIEQLRQRYKLVFTQNQAVGPASEE